MADDTIIFDIASDILECARAALADTTAGAPARRYVAIGEPAHDNCCDGQLTATLVRQYPSSRFPDEDYTKAPCGPPFVAIDINVEIVRCAPMIDDFGQPPTVTELNASARTVAIDATAVWNGVSCCLIARSDIWTSRIREQLFITPEGGCVGSRLSVTIGLTAGCECG